MSDPFSPPKGDAGALRSTGAALGHIGDHLDGLKGRVASAVAASVDLWTGPRAVTFAQAGAGVQVELMSAAAALTELSGILTAQGADLQGVTDDVAEYKAQADKITAEMSKPLPPGQQPDPDAETHNLKLLGNWQTLAIEAKDGLRRRTQARAQRVDALLDKIVPNGDRLTPAQIRRQVTHRMGLSDVGPITDGADAWKALKGASKVVPKDAVLSDGSIDWKKAADDKDEKEESWVLKDLKDMIPDVFSQHGALKALVSAGLSSEQIRELYSQILDRTRVSDLILPKNATAAQQYAALAKDLRGGDIDPATLAKIDALVAKGSTVPGKVTLVGNPEWLKGIKPEWAEGAGKLLTVGGAGFTYFETGKDAWDEDSKQHPDWSTTHKVVDTTQKTAVVGSTSVYGGLAGAAEGGETGAEMGGAVGTLIGPEGTVIGGAIGGVGGAVVGGVIGSGVGHLVGDGIEHGASALVHGLFG